MFALRTIPRTSAPLAAKQSRMLSTQGTIAVEKLRNVLEEYRRENYAQELPGRFKKDIVKAAVHDPSHGVALEGMQRVLHNIGAAHAMSVAEMKLIFEELGDNTGAIPVQSIGEIL